MGARMMRDRKRAQICLLASAYCLLFGPDRVKRIPLLGPSGNEALEAGRDRSGQIQGGYIGWFGGVGP